MREYLLFQVYGPLQAWGDIAVGGVRPIFRQPSKSAIMGLVAGALGITRQQEDKHLLLNQSYGFAVCILHEGVPLRDYHTVQAPPAISDRDKKKRGRYDTRQDEWSAMLNERQEGKQITTVLTERDYYCDCIFQVCLWQKSSQPLLYTLTELENALRFPAFVPYLGRKSCPPALPFAPRLVQASNLKEAFQSPFQIPDWFTDSLFLPNVYHLYWDELESSHNSGLEDNAIFKIQRNDRLISRKRWQYGMRFEYHGTIAPSE